MTTGSSVGGGGAGFGGAAGVSNDARMREIGGRTSRFVFTSPSSAFLRGFFLSMSEMLSTSWRGAGATSAVTFADGGCGGFAGAPADSASSSSFFFEVLAFEAGGLWAAAALRAAGLRVAVLLLVFVASV